ncbi:MAG: AAA family ATPase, partial [Thermomicrobiales bacterium]|nr:AAA family ATPase [Thermomicrobiales bacterium]
MRIQRITFENFKGLRRTSELGALTLLTGQNGSGKSAHLQAIQYAIQGDTPAGATAEAAMGYMGVNGGAVRLDFDGGLAVRRGIIRDPRELTLSTDVSISTMPGAAAKATCAEIAARCGDFAPMHDLGAVLNLSADKRREYLLALCGAAATAEGFDVLGQIRAEFLRGRDSLSEGEDAALEWLLADLAPIAAAALSPADAVGKVAERIKARISETKAAAERARAAGLEMS